MTFRRFFPQKSLLLPAAYLYWISLYLYSPSLPVHVQSKIGDLSRVGLVLSMYGLWQMISRFPTGILADRFGWRKSLAVAGLLLLALGTVLLGSAQSYPALLISRSIIGFSAATWVLLVVLYSSTTAEGNLAVATASLSITLAAGRITATLANGWITTTWSIQPTFWLAAGAALLAALFVTLSPLPSEKRGSISLHQVGKVILKAGVLLPSLLSVVLHFADWAATFSFIPLQARSFQASSLQISLLVTLEFAVILAVTSMSIFLVKRFGRSLLLIFGFVCTAGGLFTVFAADSLAWLWLAQGLIGISIGLAYPLLLAMTLEAVPTEERATATGFHQSVYSLGMFLGPSITGALAAAIGIRPSFAICTVGVIVFAGIIGWMMKRSVHSFSPSRHQ
jgi:DHA1 family multidrug resistance protein-like MFS transporter